MIKSNRSYLGLNIAKVKETEFTGASVPEKAIEGGYSRSTVRGRMC